jgi:hypothetical protein
VFLPPPATVAAIAIPPVIFAPRAFALVIAPPVLAFVDIGPGFFAHGFIAGRVVAMGEHSALARAERAERGREPMGMFRRWRAVRHGHGPAGPVDWRGGGWREARRGGAFGWRRAWR